MCNYTWHPQLQGLEQSVTATEEIVIARASSSVEQWAESKNNRQQQPATTSASKHGGGCNSKQLATETRQQQKEHTACNSNTELAYTHYVTYGGRKKTCACPYQYGKYVTDIPYMSILIWHICYRYACTMHVHINMAYMLIYPCRIHP